MDFQPYAFFIIGGILFVAVLFSYWFFYQNKYGFRREGKNPIVHSIGVLIGLMIFVFAGMSAVQPLNFLAVITIDELFMLGVIVGYGSFTFLLLKTSALPLAEEIKLKSISTKQYIYFVVLGLALYPLVVEISSQLDRLFPVLNAFRPKGWRTFGVFYVLITYIVGPICEELIFRGVIQSRVQKYYGAMIAVVISTILFSVSRLYFDPFVAVLGAICGILVVKSGSIIPAILIQVVFGLLSMFLFRFEMIEWIENTKELGLLFLEEWILIFSVILTFIMCKILGLKLSLKKSKNEII